MTEASPTSFLLLVFLFGLSLVPLAIKNWQEFKTYMVTAIFLCPTGPTGQYLLYLNDHWSPNTIFGTKIGIEDFFYAAFYIALPFAAYPILFGFKRVRIEPLTRQWKYGWMVFFFVILVGISYLMYGVLSLNSTLSSITDFTVCALIIVYFRPDLLVPSLISGVICAVSIFTALQVTDLIRPGTLQAWCLACNPTHIYILRVNFEEVLYGLTWGAFFGVLYPFLLKQKFVRP